MPAGIEDFRDFRVPMSKSDRLPFEHAVYGSFPFWDKGYAILAHSPGCRADWLSDFETVCRKYGEPTRDASAAGAVFSTRLASGPWLIVRVDPQGNDDHGRPGALAFHGFFVASRDFRRARFDPFVFDDLPPRAWDRQTTALPQGNLPLQESLGHFGSPPEEAQRIARALIARRKVAIEAMTPVHELARSVWQLLPTRVRRRTSCATLTFSNENRFDFLAIPRLGSALVDDSYVGPPTFGERVIAHELGEEPQYQLQFPRGWWLWAAAALIACCLVGYFFVRPAPETQEPRAAQSRPPVATPRDESTGKDDRDRVLERLIDFAERYRVIGMSSPSPTDPSLLMAKISEKLRYRGLVLAPQDLRYLRAQAARLRTAPLSESGLAADYDRALDMHAHILHFLPDQPLPADFASRKLGSQLLTFAWSFHVFHDSRRKVREIPDELSTALEAPSDLKTGEISAQFPAVRQYEVFLKQLPMRQATPTANSGVR
jgi:hypothetical protein